MSSGPTVFVVDDDEAAAASVAALMSAIGLRCVVFNSAEAFIDAYEGSETGCLVLDVRLQGMSGIELGNILRDSDFKIPTILVSGNADPDLHRQVFGDEKIFAFLEKPYAGEELCRLVKAALKSNDSESQ